MARPKPNIIIEHVDNNYNSEQILESEAIYAVFYQQKPINIRTLNTLVNTPGPKYKKVSFSNSGHAFNLAERLNDLFNTNDFEVYKFTQGELVNEEDEKKRVEILQEFILKSINDAAVNNTYTQYDIFLNSDTLRLRRLGLKRMSGIYDSYRLQNDEVLTSGQLMKLFRNAEYPYYIGKDFVVLFSEKDAFMCKLGGVGTWIESSHKGD